MSQSVSLCVSVRVRVCVCVGASSISGDASDAVRADHHRPCSVPPQTSDRQILLPHFPRPACPHLDLFRSSAHHWKVTLVSLSL